ncbi:MAG: hypothetical protein AAFU80_15940 [Pseudomonadota bacterium]
MLVIVVRRRCVVPGMPVSTSWRWLGDVDGSEKRRGEVVIPSELRVFPTCHGPEFAGRLFDQWTYLNEVELDV